MNHKVTRRLYHFCPPGHVLENIANRQLKVSRFSKCNDPFELAAFSLKDKKIRKRHQEWIADFENKQGLICFCRSWKNPVLWSHYAGHHSGLCLGFDVWPHKFVDVKYVSERLYPEINSENFFQHIGKAQMEDVVATKFIHWSYEEEVRFIVTFSEPPLPGDLVFHPYSDEIRLRQVIIGPRSEICAEEIQKAVGDDDIEILQSRLGFRRFEVVHQKNKKLWNSRTSPSKPAAIEQHPESDE